VAPEGGYLTAAGDIDGDGADDLFTALRGPKIHLTRGGADFTTRAQEVVDVGAPIDFMALADLNGDGHLDVLIRAAEDGENRALPGDGHGGFGSPLAVPRMHLIRGAEPVLADLNGDGFPDTVTRGPQDTIIPYLGDGAFGFAAGDPFFLGDELYLLYLTDMDGDGIVDLAGVGYGRGLFVARGIGAARFEEPRRFMSSGTFLAMEDVNGDGLKDVLTYNGGGGAGDFEAIVANRDFLLASPRAYGLAPRASTSGDFNGDGRIELAVASFSGFLSILQFVGRDLVTAGSISFADGLLFLGSRDIDGDGADDVVVARSGKLTWLRSKKDFSFEEERTLVEGTSAAGFTFRDLDGDGLDDVFFSGFVVARGCRGGGFEPPQDFRAGGEGPGGPGSLIDFNGDGLMDVLQAPQRGGVLFFHAGGGTSGFEAPRFLPSGGEFSGGLALGDFNGDELIDIAQGPRGEYLEDSGPPKVWYTQGNGEFGAGKSLLDPFGRDEGTQALIAVDLNGDGADDLLSADPGGYTLAFLGGPDGLSTPPFATYGPTSPGFLVAGNFAGDAATDIISGGEDGILVTLGHLVGSGFTRGDANGDGVVDVSDPIRILGWLYLGAAPPSCESAADTNDDGRLDLSDAVYALSFKFLGGEEPPAPFPSCGKEATVDGLTCSASPACKS
jgi:hypothetical protein